MHLLGGIHTICSYTFRLHMVLNNMVVLLGERAMFAKGQWNILWQHKSMRPLRKLFVLYLHTNLKMMVAGHSGLCLMNIHTFRLEKAMGTLSFGLCRWLDRKSVVEGK